MDDATQFICSNQSDDKPTWHIGVKKELRGDRTGKLLGTYYLTACNGQQLGGAYGYTVRNAVDGRDKLCARCFRKQAS
jgi:hypothetical protein